MTEPTPAGSVPAPSAQPQPGTPASMEPAAPAEAPQQPAKKGGTRRIISIVVLVLIVGGGILVRFVLPAIEDSKWKVGACVNFLPTSIIETSADEAGIVGCDDASAQSEIVAVFEDSTNAQAEELCPSNAVASMTRDTTMYCLAELS